MRILYYISILLLFFLATACSIIKDKQQEARLNFPHLGSLVKDKKTLWHSASEQIGFPYWEEPLTVNIKEFPFNKKTYTAYATYIQQAGKINSIAYTDSLPYKPKYIQLQLRNKIGLTHLLNTPINDAVRSYLEQDPNYGMVTTLLVTVPDAQLPVLLHTEKVLLQKDHQNHTYLVLQNGTTQTKLQFSELQIFAIETTSFCWGKDRYGKLMIKTLLQTGAKCPKNTYRKITKMDTQKTYLKF